MKAHEVSRPLTDGETRLAIESDTDIMVARRQGRAMAVALGFSPGDATLVATAISELARNIVMYARHGEIVLSPLERGGETALVITARDKGPGIPDIQQAMQDGYSTSGRLGVGLPGVQRLGDEFTIVSEPGKGTTVTVTKWKRARTR